ncbi:MAG: SpoIID/LytB domain-containing protein [Oscillospiraceae bacterium]|nr:SpoIID/LytB domain-containing protein [Oscillospiraceae bacterium]
MREYVIIILVFAVLLFTVPFLPLGSISAQAPNAASFPEKFTILLESGKILEMSVIDYLTGCLFAQIPVNYSENALKAQAIAAHTYALRLIASGVALSDSPTECQPFFTEEKAREHYGSEYNAYYSRVRRAAEYGAKRVILHSGEPIYAVYHSISSGVTNTASTVWGRDYPYLKSVGSSWDREHEHYLCTNEMTTDYMRLSLLEYDKTLTMPVDYSLWFTDVVKNDYGYVMSLKAGSTPLSGGDMWRMFNLRSIAFEITYNGNAFSIETRGFGHGVGLSQYGAEVLSGRGYSPEEILKYYYTGVEIIEL